MADGCRHFEKFLIAVSPQTLSYRDAILHGNAQRHSTPYQKLKIWIFKNLRLPTVANFKILKRPYLAVI